MIFKYPETHPSIKNAISNHGAVSKYSSKYTPIKTETTIADTNSIPHDKIEYVFLSSFLSILIVYNIFNFSKVVIGYFLV